MAASMNLQLSTRHRQVIDGIARGLSYQEIASELGLHLRTVRVYGDQARLILRVPVARKLPEALRAHDNNLNEGGV